MAKIPKKNEDERSPAETERLAGKTLKTLLSTPPKPFTPAKKKKSDGK